ncbi:MAG: hypothetical protein ABUT39_04850 [Acidobacteriota bacterium]
MIEDGCYHLTPEYAETWWGRYIWIYQGKGRLRLTRESLRFDGRKLRFDIPLSAIAGIEAGQFSRVAKAFGLAFIRLRYQQDGNENTVLLVPAKSPFAPTWKTNRVIVKWLETLGRIEEISSRVKPPLNLPISSPFFRR